MESVGLDLVYKGDFKLSKSVFGYEYLNFTIAPRELTVAVHEFSAFASARCVFNYSLAQPAVRVSSEKTSPLSLELPGRRRLLGAGEGLNVLAGRPAGDDRRLRETL